VGKLHGGSHFYSGTAVIKSAFKWACQNGCENTLSNAPISL